MKRDMHCHGNRCVLVLLSLFVCAGAITAAAQNVAAFIFAHPDDELTVGPLLATYAKQGSQIYVVSVTSGQQGDAYTDIPAGPELGAAREAELTAACLAYSVNAPYFLQEQDGQLASFTTSQRTAVKAELRGILQNLGADVVVTYGPDGFTGHSDHIAVGAIVTELIDEWYAESAPNNPPQKLYYTMFPASLWDELPASLQFFVPVDDALATSVIDGANGIAETQAAVEEYVTQFPPAVMLDIQNFVGNTQQGQIPLRLVRTLDGSIPVNESSIFEGLNAIPIQSALLSPAMLIALVLARRRVSRRVDSAVAE